MAKVVRATTPTFIFETSDDVDLTLASGVHVTFSSFGVLLALHRVASGCGYRVPRESADGRFDVGLSRNIRFRRGRPGGQPSGAQ